MKREYKKEILGFTAGNFDLLHPGYIKCFKEAKRHCDRFIIFLQKDPSLHRKSKYKPVIPLWDRYEALMSIRYIDDVYIYQTEEELYELIKFFQPDVRILGEDYITDKIKYNKGFTGDDLPPRIIYTTRSHGWSTTKLKDKITKQTIEQNPVFNEMFGMMEKERTSENVDSNGKVRDDDWVVEQYNRNRAPEDQVHSIQELSDKMEDVKD